jgi:serine phosphatase RsbU (regulator of sigma subunit)
VTKNKLSTRHSAPDTILLAAADCTGHGVPGAMVSVVCNNGLNRSVREYGLTDPAAILDKTREIVIQEFEKSEEEVKDGMDIALVSLEFGHFDELNNQKNEVTELVEVPVVRLRYAGAHNPLWIIRKGATEVEEIKANKQPIGKFLVPEPYTTHTVELNEGDSFYIFSDGYPDQFGGERGKKFKSGNFKKLLVSIQNETMERQHELLNQTFEDWRGDIEQIDDVCIIGVKV